MDPAGPRRAGAVEEAWFNSAGFYTGFYPAGQSSSTSAALSLPLLKAEKIRCKGLKG